MNELVSIIIPVYNVIDYLKKSIDSVLAQTYQNIEIIIIDDGSDDGSENICEEYSVHESVTLIHKQNGGLSDARNVGLENAKGKYILFVDSDDIIHRDMISSMLQIMQSLEADIVECGVQDLQKDESIYINEEKLLYEVYEHDEALEKFLNYNSRIVAWNKLYKAELFDDLRFPLGKIHEDEFLVPFVVDRCKRYCLIKNKNYYGYVYRKESITKTTKFNIGRLDIIEAQKKRLEYFSLKYQGKYDAIIYIHFFLEVKALYLEAVRLDASDEVKMSIGEELKEIKNMKNRYGKLSFYDRVKLMIYDLFPNFYSGIKNIIKR